MRSKEVEKAIKVIKKDLDLAKKELDIETDCTEPYRPRIAYLYQQKETYDTLLSYIETLEQLPNKIRDKIKELDKQYKEIESKYTEEQINMGSEDLDDYIEMQNIAKAEEVLKSIIGE